MSRRLIQLGLGLAGGLAVAYGVWQGEGVDVWVKAAHICLECIGLG